MIILEVTVLAEDSTEENEDEEEEARESEVRSIFRIRN